MSCSGVDATLQKELNDNSQRWFSACLRPISCEVARDSPLAARCSLASFAERGAECEAVLTCNTKKFDGSYVKEQAATTCGPLDGFEMIVSKDIFPRLPNFNALNLVACARACVCVCVCVCA